MAAIALGLALAGCSRTIGIDDTDGGAGLVVSSLTASDEHTCAVASNGSAYCWGFAWFGALGNGDVARNITPVPGTVQGLSGARALAASIHHTCALKLDGSVVCWGMNVVGQLGDGTTDDGQDGRAIPGAGVTGLADATAIAGGQSHTCVLRKDGSAACWGLNDGGQLGDGTMMTRTAPAPVIGMAGAIELGLGDANGCAVRSDGSVWCWGPNDHQQLGSAIGSSPSPIQVPGIARAVEVRTRGSHSCARLGDGTVQCWGLNGIGQLGDGSQAVERAAPGPVPGLSSVTGIALGANHTCALRSDGTVACWGSNFAGEIGDGTTAQRGMPTPVAGLSDVVQLVAGSSHNCALRRDGSLRCWGANSRGQLGDGTTENRATPVAIAVH